MSSALNIQALAQPLDGLTLYCLSKEWQQELTSARIQKVQQLNRSDWLMSLYAKPNQPNSNPEGTYRAAKLFFSLRAEMPFCCVFWGDKTASGFPDWLKPLPGNPSGFCMLLRKHLVGAQITSISVLAGERVLNIEVENATELGYQSRVILSLELMGKYSNAILIQPGSPNSQETPRILGVAHTIGEHQSRYRELAGGLPYLPPPPPKDKIGWAELSPSVLNQWAEAFQGISNPSTSISDENDIALSPSDWADVLSQKVRGLGKQMLRQTLMTFAKPALGLTSKALFDKFLLKPGSDTNHLTVEAKPCESGYVLSVQSPLKESSFEKLYLINSALKAYYWPFYERAHQKLVRRKLEVALTKQFNQTQRRLDALKLNQDESPQDLQNLAERLLLALNTGELPGHPRQLYDDLNVLRQMESMEMVTAAKWEAASVTHPVSMTLEGVYSFHVSAQWQGQNWKNLLIRLPHWEENQPDFALDVRPDLTWMEHAQQLFKQVRKRKNRQKLFDLEGARYEDRLVYLESVLCWLEQADSVSALLTMQEEFEALGWFELAKNQAKSTPKKKLQPDSEMSGILALKSSEGVPIWVGRSGEGNGRLLSRWAKPHDVWVHVHQMAGSHVLIRPVPIQETLTFEPGYVPVEEDAFSYGLPVSNQTLLEALNLAVYFSVAREGNQVPVVFTEYRYVRKIPQSYPGHVTYKQEQQAYITPDLNLIQSLLKTVQL